MLLFVVLNLVWPTGTIKETETKQPNGFPEKRRRRTVTNHYQETPPIMLLFVVLNLVWPTGTIKVDDFNISSSSSKVQETPNFSGPIRNVTVSIGREAVLSCPVTDLGSYKVGWMKADDQTILSLHTRVITHNPRISVTHDDALRTWQLRIRQLKESDRGCYMCQINTNEMKKQLGCVDVQVPPDIDDIGTSGDVIISEGENVTLSCTATGHPEPRIIWRREDGDHMLLPGSSGEMNRVDTFSGPTLRMFRVQRRQMGSYLCIASNDVPPAVSKRVTLNINFSPKVQVQKPLVGAPVAALVKLRCEVEAFPNANNYWMTEKNDVLLDGAKYHIQEKRFGYKTIMVLTIFNLTSSDFGTYSCVASNTVGKSNGSVRVYEIKIITTTTTTTTTTTPAPTTTTTTTTETNIVLEITNSDRSGGSQFNRNSMIGLQVPEEDPSENWLFPSVAPAPLELETLSGSSASSSRLCRVLFVATLMTFSLGLR